MYPTRALVPKYTNNSYISILKKRPNQKMGKEPKQTFLQRQHPDGLIGNEKMLNAAK